MSNNLKKIAKELRSYAKRCKNIKYTDALLFSFLMTGLLISGASNVVDKNIEQQKKNIGNSILDIRTTFKKAKAENDRLLKGANLELIQLMEQGDQVVKSPWSSWQFGMNYFYDSWNGTHKGRGDKAEKYPYEGVFTRGNWWQRNVSPESKTYSRVISTNDPHSALTNTRNDLGLIYGLVGSREVPDEGVVLIIEPKINISIPSIPNLNIAPTVINPNVNFTIPDVTTASFNEIVVDRLEPNVFEPPALNEVSTGFSQGSAVGIDTHPNYISSNGDINIPTGSVLKIRVDEKNYYREGGYTFIGKNDALQRTNPPQTTTINVTGSGYGAGTYLTSATPNSPQTFSNVLTDSFNINGNIEFKKVIIK